MERILFYYIPESCIPPYRMRRLKPAQEDLESKAVRVRRRTRRTAGGTAGRYKERIGRRSPVTKDRC